MKYLFLILLFPFAVMAHGDYTGTNTVETTNTVTTVESNSGTAGALALGQCSYDYSHFLQGCIAVGTFDGTQAGAFGLGKKIGEDMLINGGIAIGEGGDVAGGAALNFKFK